MPAPPGSPIAGPGRAEDQARLLHRAREPHLRPGARRRPARRRGPQADALRSGDHAQRPRAGPALPAARPRLRQLRGVDRRAFLDLRRRRSRTTSSRPGSRTTPAAGAPTTSASTPSPGRPKRFLFDQAEKQGISWFNFGEAVAGTVPLPDAAARAEEEAQVSRQAPQVRPRPERLLPQRRVLGGYDVVCAAAGQRVGDLRLVAAAGRAARLAVALRVLQDALQRWVADEHGARRSSTRPSPTTTPRAPSPASASRPR